MRNTFQTFLKVEKFDEKIKDLSLDLSTPSLSIRCPHCKEKGIFRALSTGVWHHKMLRKDEGGTMRYSFGAFLRICPNVTCQGIVFTSTKYVYSGLDRSHEPNGFETLCFPPESIDFNPNGIPNKLVSVLEEAITCYSVGAYRAAAIMVRRLLEEICSDSGAKGKDLFSRLDALRKKVILPEELFEAMSELKALGNDSAHVESKAFNSIGKEEAAISIEISKEILKARFQLKGLVERLRSRRSSQGSS